MGESRQAGVMVAMEDRPNWPALVMWWRPIKTLERLLAHPSTKGVLLLNLLAVEAPLLRAPSRGTFHAYLGVVFMPILYCVLPLVAALFALWQGRCVGLVAKGLGGHGQALPNAIAHAWALLPVALGTCLSIPAFALDQAKGAYPAAQHWLDALNPWDAVGGLMHLCLGLISLVWMVRFMGKAHGLGWARSTAALIGGSILAVFSVGAAVAIPALLS